MSMSMSACALSCLSSSSCPCQEIAMYKSRWGRERRMWGCVYVWSMLGKGCGSMWGAMSGVE